MMSCYKPSPHWKLWVLNKTRLKYKDLQNCPTLWSAQPISCDKHFSISSSGNLEHHGRTVDLSIYLYIYMVITWNSTLSIFHLKVILYIIISSYIWLYLIYIKLLFIIYNITCLWYIYIIYIIYIYICIYIL